MSGLLRKIQNLAGQRDPANCLKELAVRRGCRHYEGSFPATTVSPAAEKLTDEEVGVGLCLGQLTYDPLNIRIGAELLSAESCRPKAIAFLARQERCETVIGYVARCGAKVEPENQKWRELLAELGRVSSPPSGALPHWTRFVSMTGITRGGGPDTKWLRPKRPA